MYCRSTLSQAHAPQYCYYPAMLCWYIRESIIRILDNAINTDSRFLNVSGFYVPVIRTAAANLYLRIMKILCGKAVNVSLKAEEHIAWFAFRPIWNNSANWTSAKYHAIQIWHQLWFKVVGANLEIVSDNLPADLLSQAIDILKDREYPALAGKKLMYKKTHLNLFGC